MARFTLRTLAALGLLTAGINGCSSLDKGEGRADYIEPAAGGVGRATLRTTAGIIIQGVDGDLVNKPNVIVSAGLRRVRVIRNSTAWDFDLTCEKGHTYEFTRVGTFDGRLKVRDVMVGDSLIISNNDISPTWD